MNRVLGLSGSHFIYSHFFMVEVSPPPKAYALSPILDQVPLLKRYFDSEVLAEYYLAAHRCMVKKKPIMYKGRRCRVVRVGITKSTLACRRKFFRVSNKEIFDLVEASWLADATVAHIEGFPEFDASREDMMNDWRQQVIRAKLRGRAAPSPPINIDPELRKMLKQLSSN